jgi:hypothetical protein
MNDEPAWGARLGLKPVGQADDEAEGGYKPWVTGNAGFARDLIIMPAKGSGELTRFEPYMQAITLELNDTATQLGLMCHTTGQIIFIEGQGLDELATQISAKRVNSVHVWSKAEGEKPQGAVVTAVRFRQSIADIELKED